MAKTYNPPPNWPKPQDGWAPPSEDWRPDASWGNPPEGWVLWTPEATSKTVDRDESGAARPMKKSATWPWIVAVLVLAGGCGALSGIHGDDKPAIDSTEARAGCRVFVDRQLKAPATAEYSGWSAVPDGSANGWSVSGTVDSENSFGAKIRSTFTCTMHTAGTQWVLESLSGL